MLFLAAGATAARSASAQTQPPGGTVGPGERAAARGRAQQRRAFQLQNSLEALARVAPTSQLASAIGGFVLGGLTVTYGVTVAVEGDELGQTAGRAALSGIALTAGSMLTLRAVLGLISPEESDQERLQRWQAHGAAGGADLETIARFEGELAAEADRAHAQRIATAWSSLAVALGGGGLIAFGASDALEGSAQSTAFIFGGTLLGLGLLQSATAWLFASAHERVWQQYQGLRMADASPLLRISLQPVVAPRALALGVRAQF